MAITDRFLKYLKVELNDFLGKYEEEEETKQRKSRTKKSEDWTDSFYDFINGNSSSEEEETKQSSKDQWTHRRERRSRNHSSRQQEYHSSSWQDTNTNIDPEAKYYEALEIKKGASAEEIKLAYRQVMKKYHPDKFASNPEKQKYAEQLAQKINDAYDYLKKKHGI